MVRIFHDNLIFFCEMMQYFMKFTHWKRYSTKMLIWRNLLSKGVLLNKRKHFVKSTYRFSFFLPFLYGQCFIPWIRYFFFLSLIVRTISRFFPLSFLFFSVYSMPFFWLFNLNGSFHVLFREFNHDFTLRFSNFGARMWIYCNKFPIGPPYGHEQNWIFIFSWINKK